MEKISRDIFTVRHMICNWVLIVYSILAVPLLVASLYRVVIIGWQPLMIAHLLLAIGIWSVTLLRDSLPYGFRAISIVVVMTLIGAVGLWQLGLVAGGIASLVAAPAIATILLGMRGGVYAACAGFLITVAIGLYVIFTNHLPPFDLADYATKPLGWITFIFSFLLAVGVLIAVTGIANKYLMTILQDKIHLLLENTGDGIVGVDMEGNVTFANQAAAKILGVDRNDLMGKNQHAVFCHTAADGGPYPSDKSPLYASLSAGEDNRVAGDVFWRRNGSSFPVDYTATPIKEKGKVAGAVIVFRDITEAKKSEQALREAHNIINRSPAVAFRWTNTKEWPVEFVTDNVVTLTGYTAEEFTSGQIDSKKVIHPQDLERVAEEVSIFSKEKRKASFVHKPYRIVTKSGKINWIYGRTFIQRDKDGKITHYEGVCVDITERMLAEEAIRKLSHATEASPSAIFIIDGHGTIEYINPKFTEITDFTAHDVIGQHFRTLNADAESAALYREILEAISSGNEWRGEFSNRKKNGEVYWTSAGIAPVKDAQGQITHYVGVAEDISERRRFEENLKAARKFAENANQTKSSFLSNMSHEIRTPLNAVLGFLELVLEDGFLSKSQSDYLTLARISARDLLGLLNDILDVSKMESGKLDIEKHPFNLGRLMQEIYATMEPKAREKGLEFQFDFQPFLSKTFIGDPLRLKQVIVNLVDNAIKFTENGRVSMQILSIEEENQLYFKIADTGIGIAADRISQIFKPFTQADISTTRRFGGTGLGTAIARELVELMGGQIWAESAEGKGSTFHFTINLTPTDQVSQDSGLFIVPGKADLRACRSGFRVLLAEDVKTNVEIARIRLKQQGHVVKVAWNGRQAVEAFKEGEFNLILMDNQMPVMDGIEATKCIREMETGGGGHVPIIAITAGVTQDERKEYFEAGMDAIVAKPVNFHKLFETMENLVPEGEGVAVSENKMDISGVSELEWPALEGVDIEKGIKKWQDPDVYAKELLVFSDEYGNATVELSRLMDEGHIDRALDIIHSLKGVAGTLLITEVAHITIDIERALKENHPYDVKGLLSNLSTALHTVVSSIKQLKTLKKIKKMPKKEMDLPYLKELFMKMIAAFDQLSPYEIELLLSELEAFLSQDLIKPIAKQLEMFNFDEGKQKTVMLAEKLKIDLDG